MEAKKHQTNANRFGKNEHNNTNINTHFNCNTFDNNNTVININYVCMVKTKYLYSKYKQYRILREALKQITFKKQGSSHLTQKDIKTQLNRSRRQSTEEIIELKNDDSRDWWTKYFASVESAIIEVSDP